MKPALVMSIVCVLTVTVGTGQRQATTRPARSAPGSRVHKVEELTWRQIDALNRQRTLFILPVGMLEQHGPHLPIGADTIGVTYEANRVSTRVSQALPEWHVVMMPAVNYGHGGANLLGDRPIHPGTYAIRQLTLRSLVADIGARIAENGFKWIFVMNGHGAPTHNIALNEASDFVSETYAVTMLHVTALFQADAAIQSSGQKIKARYFSAADLRARVEGCGCRPTLRRPETRRTGTGRPRPASAVRKNRRGSYPRSARSRGEYGCAWATDVRRTDAPVVVWDLRGSQRPNSPRGIAAPVFPLRCASLIRTRSETPQHMARSRRPRPPSTGTPRAGGRNSIHIQAARGA